MSRLYKMPRKRRIPLNTMFCADNLEVMKQLPAESIDLIYIDPPFCTQTVQKSKAWDNHVQVGSFDDKWGGGLNSYILWLSVRLREMHRLLKPTGTLYVHLDYKTVHYIKVELDKIFGSGNLDKGKQHLINEIIWCYSIGGKSRTKYGNKHDTILMYGKDKKKWTFNEEFARVPRKKSTHMKVIEVNGEKVQVKKDKKSGKVYHYPVKDGKISEDYWLGIEQLNREEKERLGYPTQKPLKLMERIISVSSNEGDIVADFFCGCGTTISAAEKLKRNWLGVDVSKDATTTIRKRMADDHNLQIDITPLKTLKKEEVLALDHKEFEKYMVRCIGGLVNEKAGADGGVDGQLEDGTPIQVKQSEKIGRPELDKFYKHVEYNGKGVIIAKSFARTVKEEVARILNEKGWEITLMTVDDVLREHYPQSS